MAVGYPSTSWASCIVTPAVSAIAYILVLQTRFFCPTRHDVTWAGEGVTTDAPPWRTPLRPPSVTAGPSLPRRSKPTLRRSHQQYRRRRRRSRPTSPAHPSPVAMHRLMLTLYDTYSSSTYDERSSSCRWLVGWLVTRANGFTGIGLGQCRKRFIVTMGLSCLVFEIWPQDGQRTDRCRHQRISGS